MICLSRGILQQKRLPKEKDVDRYIRVCHTLGVNNCVAKKEEDFSPTSKEVCSEKMGQSTIPQPSRIHPKVTPTEELSTKSKEIDEHQQSFGTLPVSAQEYYMHLQEGSAMRFLVNQQVFRTEDPSAITDEDGELHLLLASVSYELSKNKNEQLGRIFELIGVQTQIMLRRLSEERDKIIAENKKLIENWIDSVFRKTTFP